MSYESRRPTAAEIEADLAYWKGLPIRFVESLIRAYLSAQYRGQEGTTPEGRSRIMAPARDTIWDALLDAVSRYPCPSPVEMTPPPAQRSAPPKRRAR
jgi:hypothetical protein